MAIGRGKKLKAYKYPSHSPNDGQASPCLNSYSAHIPILIACSTLCLVLPHHCPISCTTIHRFPISHFCSCKPGYMLFLQFNSIQFIHLKDAIYASSKSASHRMRIISKNFNSNLEISEFFLHKFPNKIKQFRLVCC